MIPDYFRASLKCILSNGPFQFEEKKGIHLQLVSANEFFKDRSPVTSVTSSDQTSPGPPTVSAGQQSSSYLPPLRHFRLAQAHSAQPATILSLAQGCRYSAGCCQSCKPC